MKKIIVYPVLLFLCFNARSQSDTLKENSDSLDTFFVIPIFNTGGDDGEAQVEQQDVSPLLQSSRDVFAQFASFQFGAARYRMRGASARNMQITLNGILVNSPETGAATWSSWGGLNDVTRFAETRIGNTSSRYSFSGISGYVNIDTRASSFKNGSRVSYSSANRIYKNRIMFTHNTGLLKSGWAFSFSGSFRQGNNVYVQGSSFLGNALYFSADKKIGKKHLLGITSFWAPIEQARISSSTLETYQLANSNYYNSNWGFQNGKMRSASVSKNSKPAIIISDVLTLSESCRLNTSVYYNFGKSSFSGLTWHDAPNPDPDYYRYLPSYFYQSGEIAAGDFLTKEWKTNNDIQQINWDRLIQMNQANLYTPPQLLGQGINTNETRARYVLENRVEASKNLGFNSVLNKRKNNYFFSGGISANYFQNRKYKQLQDLLGASYWLDVDQFAENLGVEEYLQQNDLDNPNKKIKEGDKFGYDYVIHIRKAETWAQIEYASGKLEWYGGISASTTKIWREGFMANGKFPNSSKGESEKLSFLNGGIKSGVTYKISGRKFITVNGLLSSRSPESTGIFISPRVRNDIVRNIKNEELISFDANYHLKYPTLKLRATFYYTQINNQTWLRSFWHDSYNTTVNLIMRNVNQNYQGIEFGLEKALKTSHIIQAAFGYGEFTYNNRPTLEAWQDNNNTALFENRTAYLKEFKIGGSPQMVSGLGYKYMGKSYWFAGLYGNYISEIFIEPNPDRRTDEAVGKFQTNESLLANEIIKQEQLPGYFVLNFNGGKSIRIKKKYYCSMNFSVNNILNNKTNIVGGFESLRWDRGNINKFPNKYTYMHGTTYMLILNFSF